MMYRWEDIPIGTKVEGLAWYGKAAERCLEISLKTNTPIHKTMGVVAALSPKMSWENNLKQAEILCQTRDCSALSRSKAYACEILDCDGDFISIIHLLKGRKTGAFFCNIMGDIGYKVVTLDSHMGEICGVPNWTPRRYEYWEDRICWMARELNIKPSAVQATLWLHHKNQKLKIRNDKQ